MSINKCNLLKITLTSDIGSELATTQCDTSHEHPRPAVVVCGSSLTCTRRGRASHQCQG